MYSAYFPAVCSGQTPRSPMREAKSFRKMLKSPLVKVWYLNSPMGSLSLAQSTEESFPNVRVVLSKKSSLQGCRMRQTFEG